MVTDRTAANGFSPEPPPHLLLRNVIKKGSESSPILDNVNFEMRQGEVVALIGSSQSGKTTLLHCCVDRDSFDEGHIEILGSSVSTTVAATKRRLSQQVGFISQRPQLVPEQTVLRNLFVPSLPFPGHTNYMRWMVNWITKRNEAYTALAQVNLAAAAKKPAQDLSLEEAQQVAIAAILLQRPQILIADDPVGLFDPATAIEMMNTLISFVRKFKITFLFSSHHLEHAIRYADRIIALTEGKIELDAPVREPLAQAQAG